MVRARKIPSRGEREAAVRFDESGRECKGGYKRSQSRKNTLAEAHEQECQETLSWVSEEKSIGEMWKSGIGKNDCLYMLEMVY